MKRLINYVAKIQEYNNTCIDEFSQIYSMNELFDFLINYGYEEDEINQYLESNGNNSINIINSNDFDSTDDYFWLNQNNGYLYSGSAKDAYNIVVTDKNVNKSTNDDNNEESIESDIVHQDIFPVYRFELIINSQHFGLLQGIDELINKELITERFANKVDKAFSFLPVPEMNIYKNKISKAYFTKLGLEHFEFILTDIKLKLKNVCTLNLIIKKKLNDNEKILYQDEYQVIISE